MSEKMTEKWLVRQEEIIRARLNTSDREWDDAIILKLVQNVRRLRSESDPLPCGHPVGCATDSEKGTNYCRWCAEVDSLKSEAIVWHPWPGEKPKTNDQFILSSKFSDGREMTNIDEWDTGRMEWSKFAYSSAITAWAELPAPYEVV